MKQWLKVLPELVQIDELSDVVMMIGEILIEANAEAYRIEDSLKRILTAFNCKAEIIAQSTSLTVMIIYPDQKQRTLVRRVSKHQTNLSHIHAVNSISRNLTSKQYSLSYAKVQLSKLTEIASLRTKIMSYFGLLMLGCSFSLVFKGGLNEFTASFVIGVLFAVIYKISEFIGLSELMFDLSASLVVSLLVILLTKIYTDAGLSLNSTIVLTSSIMPLVPGIALTNALRDLLNGDTVSGSNRLMEALIIAGIIAVGIGFGMGIGGNGGCF